MRTTRGVLEYRSRDERALTAVLPSSPAAVRVYGADGCCAALCLDLDITRGGRQAVAADAERLTGWLQQRGARVVTDRSPAGGVHIYVPLAQRLPFDSAREVVEALAASHPTLDPGPHRSLKTGCIRPPGAAHKNGGHQQLTTPLPAAYDTLRRRNSPEVLEAIREHLHQDITAWRATLVATTDTDTDTATTPARAIPARLRAVAETGVWDRTRYASASEARQAVIAGAVGAGWALADVAVRLADGRWPGLAALYARYSSTHRRGALARDWHAARTWLATVQQPPDTGHGKNHVRKSPTSLPATQGGTPGVVGSEDDHDHIRTWRTVLRAVELHRFPGRRGHLARFLLRALGEAAHKTGTRYVAFGTRSLAVATGSDHSSVAAVLRRLAAQSDGWIDLIEAARGEHADLYALTIPADLADVAADLRWDKGHAHALRPAFRELGHVAAFVFEAIEAGRATTITTLVRTTGLSRSAVSVAVDVLVAHGLVDRSPAGLTARADRLRAVAERLGALDTVSAQLRRYAQERRLWRAYLARHDPGNSPGEPTEDYWWPPDDDAVTLTNAAVAA